MFGRKKKHEHEREEENPNVVYVKEDYSDWPYLDAIQGYKEETGRLIAAAMAILKLSKGELKHGYYPKGILLSGDPGVGKTTAAKGMIRCAGLPTILVPADPSAEDVSNAFAAAADMAPCFIFIDDVDRIVPSEDPLSPFSSDASNGTLKTLLACIDGVSQVPGVVVVMTTNSYYGLDEALRRPGRTDLHVPFGLPDDASREEIVAHYLKQYDNLDPKLAPIIAKKMGGLTGAQIKTIINDVWIYHASEGNVSEGALLDTFQKSILETSASGILKKVPMKKEDFERVCYHEAGHAVAFFAVKGEPTDVCVLSQEGSSFGGWTQARYDDDTKVFFSGKDCIAEIACCLGGLAAEKQKFGNWTTGVISDMSSANKVLSNYMFCCLIDGKDEPSFEKLPTLIPAEAAFDLRADGAVQVRAKKTSWSEDQYAALKSGYELAKKSVAENPDLLEAIASRLMTKYIVSAEEISDLAASLTKKETAAAESVIGTPLSAGNKE